MQVKTRSIHFDADAKLIEFIEEKLNKLDQFFDKLEAAEVVLRVEHDSKERENKQVEIKVLVPGPDLFASKRAKSFEEGADQAVEALRKQLIKSKQKMRNV